jgi:glycosyltransferase involved in cell wall biosynthesis
MIGGGGERTRIWLPAIRAGSGSDVFVERLASGLAKRGYDPVVTWFPHRLEFAPALLKLAKPPDATALIHANAAQAFAFKRPGIPLVSTELHYVLDPAFAPFKTPLQDLNHRLIVGPNLKRSFAVSDAITAISHFTAGVLERLGVCKVDATIPLWLDLDLFKPATVASRSEGPLRILFVGNGTRRKGADVIPRLAAVLGEFAEFVCTSGLRQQLSRHALPNIRFLGRVSESELVAEYQRCDLAIVPSRYEGFGYAALEAMACGKPVVGFASGAVQEVVGAEMSRYLSPVDDLAHLEQTIRRLGNDAGLRDRLGVEGRRRAEAQYSESRGVDRYSQLYQGLIARQT